jgi:hypothetical protein
MMKAKSRTQYSVDSSGNTVTTQVNELFVSEGHGPDCEFEIDDTVDVENANDFHQGVQQISETTWNQRGSRRKERKEQDPEYFPDVNDANVEEDDSKLLSNLFLPCTSLSL